VFAHLFEHLMFKGSKNVQPESHTSMLGVGRRQSRRLHERRRDRVLGNGAGQYLPLVLCSKRIGWRPLTIDKDTFTNEREVVKEERRMRVDNQPYGRLNEIIYDQAFTVHPYKQRRIGSMQDLEAARSTMWRDFYRTFYVHVERDPVLVGDFDSTRRCSW